MLEQLGLISTFIGIFGLLDILVDEKHKNSFSEYLFGFKNHDYRFFERNIITGFVKIFISNERLNLARVFFFYTLPGLAIIQIWIWSGITGSQFVETDDKIGFLSDVFKLFIPMVLFSFVSDIWSVLITKKLFFNKNHEFPYSIIRVFADVLFSLVLPFTLLVLCIWLIALTQFTVTEDIYGLALPISLYAAALSSIALSLLTLIVLLVGVGIRCLLKLTRINIPIALWTKFHNYPFTFLGVLVGLIGVGIKGF